MIAASKEFKEKLKTDRPPLANYADIILSDGTFLSLDPNDFMIGGCQIEDKTTDGKFGVGFCIGKTLKIRLENQDERFSRYDFYQSVIHLYVAMLLDDGSIEKIRKGVYYATVPETPGDTIQISAVDGMYRLDRDYSSSLMPYPATLQEILSGACLDCGIPIGFRQFDNMGFVVQKKPEKATYRQIVSYAAQIAGYNARVDNDGYMQLVWYDSSLLDRYNYNGGSFMQYQEDTVVDGGDFTDYSTDTIITGGDFSEPMPEHIFRIKSLDVHTDDVQITGVRVVGEDEKTAISGEEGYLVEVKGNPFVNGKEQDVSGYLGARMVGMVFRPFSAQVLGNPLYEPFDVVMVSDRKGNVYNSVINSVSYTIGAYTQIACQAEDPLRNGSNYVSAAAQAVVEARRNAEKQLSTYDKAVQQMNQLAMNAMGFHTTVEDQPDGSRIVYLHDKPALEDSKTVYKQTIDGFFISTDGGKSYAAGFDKNGNVIVNVLYAIGIVCDWIRGGTLTLGGDNNVNGSLRILNSSGAQIGRWDKDGIVATKGTFSGALSAATGTFKGELSAATGSFKGTVTATTLNSANANITGGSFNVSTSSNNDSAVKIKYGSNETYITPNRLTVKDSSGEGHYYSNSIMLLDGNYVFFHVNPTNLIYDGNFTVHGTKNRVVKTRNYSDRLLYCYETSKPYFGDIGEAVLDEEGICYVSVDDIFLETINTDCQYQVFLQKYGQGDIWVEERRTNYFIVKGTPDLRFGWEIKARQAGFETERLEQFSYGQKENIVDYESEAQNYIDNYYVEVLNL